MDTEGFARCKSRSVALFSQGYVLTPYRHQHNKTSVTVVFIRCFLFYTFAQEMPLTEDMLSLVT